MIRLNDFIAWGFVQKTHGFKGKVIVRAHPEPTHDIDTTEPVFLMIDGGLVPFFFTSAAEYTDESLLVSLRWYDTPEVAKKLIGCELFIPLTAKKKRKKRKDNQQEDYQGYTITDATTGFAGVVAGLIRYPSHAVLEVAWNNTLVLIPHAPEIVTSVNHRKRTMEACLPEGLLEIN